MDRTNSNPPNADDIKALTQVVSTALKGKINGQTQKYSIILQQLRTGTDAILYKLFIALHRCIHDISMNINYYEELITLLLNIKFRSIPNDAIQTLTNTQSILNNVSSVLSNSNISTSTANAITTTTILSTTTSTAITSNACIVTILTLQMYIRLLQALVTTNPTNFLLPVCRTLIKGLTTTQQDADTYALLRAKNVLSTNNNESFPTTNQQILTLLPLSIIKEISTILTSYNETIYTSLYTILTNVPTGITALFTSLAESIPHKRFSFLLYETYIRHTLRLITLIPSLRDRMIAAIIDRMVDLDVDIVLDLLPDIEEENSSSSNEIPTTSSSRSNSPTNNNTITIDEEYKQSEEYLARQATIQTAAKLDTIFLLMLRYIHGSICGCHGTISSSSIETNNKNSMESEAEKLKLLSSNGIRPSPDPILDNDYGLSCTCIQQRVQQILGTVNNNTNKTDIQNNTNNMEIREHMFALMLGVFERSVLLTHRSKFIQFLLFYTCALDNNFTDRFVGRLVTHIRNADRSPLWRATSAVYLGSFLARAATVDNTTVRSALFYMLEWAHGYVDLWDAHVSYAIQMMAINGELEHKQNSNNNTIQNKSLIWETESFNSSSTSDSDSNSSIGSSTTASSSSSTSSTSSSASSVYSSDSDDEDIDYHLIAPNLIPRYMDPELPVLPLPSLFHSIMQAIFYVICFRAAEFRLLAGGVEFLTTLQWDKLLESPLDPLAHCSEAVSREFARIVHVLRLAPHASLVSSAAYEVLTSTNNNRNTEENTTNNTEDIIDNTNNPQSVPALHGISMENTAIESFFPFDPFLLKDSSRYIAPIFRTWTASSIGFGIDTTFDWTETEGYDTGGGAKLGILPSSGTEMGNTTANESMTRRIRRNSITESLRRRKQSIGTESVANTDNNTEENESMSDNDDGSDNILDDNEEIMEDDDNNDIILPLPISGSHPSNIPSQVENSTSLLARMRASLNTNNSLHPSHPTSLFTSSTLSSSILAPGLVAALDNAQVTDGLLANLDIDINEYGFRNTYSNTANNTTDNLDDDDEEDNTNANNIYLSRYNRNNNNDIDEEDNDVDDEDNESNSIVSSNAARSYTKRKQSDVYTINSSPTGTNVSSSQLGSPQNSPWLSSTAMNHHLINNQRGIRQNNIPNGANEDAETNNSISLMLPPTMYSTNAENNHSVKPPLPSRKGSTMRDNSTKSTPLLTGKTIPTDISFTDQSGLVSNDSNNTSNVMTTPSNALTNTSKSRHYSIGSNASVSSRMSSNNKEDNIPNNSTTTASTHSTSRRKKSIAGFESGTYSQLSNTNNSNNSSVSINYFAGVNINRSNSTTPVPGIIGSTTVSSLSTTKRTENNTTKNKRKYSSSSSESSTNQASSIPVPNTILNTLQTGNNNTNTAVVPTTSPTLSATNLPSWEIFTSMMSNAADEIKSKEIIEEQPEVVPTTTTTTKQGRKKKTSSVSETETSTKPEGKKRTSKRLKKDV